MRVRIALAFIALLFLPAAAQDTTRPLTDMVPANDETAIDGDGNAETDALIDCYAKFAGPTLAGPGIAAPHIVRSPRRSLLLRADFTGSAAGTVGRLVCSGGGFETQNRLAVAPLDATADPSTQRLIAGWRARREAGAIAAVTARHLAPPNEEIRKLLEGIWLIGAKPDKGPCMAHWYLQTQIEFEFRKTGGRALVFEPYDLFTAIKIAGIEKANGVLTVQAEARDGGLHTFLRLRLRPAAPDRLERMTPDTSGAPSQTLYKCGNADLSVDASVGPDRLALVSPPVTGGWSLAATRPGITDADICKGTAPYVAGGPEPKSLQIELLGPDHYFVFGWGFWPEHRLAFDFVRGVEDRGKNGLLLHMQEHLEKGDGWDGPEARGKLYDLTILDRGSRIEIPELGASFVRCQPADPASAGMHRL